MNGRWIWPAMWIFLIALLTVQLSPILLRAVWDTGESYDLRDQTFFDGNSALATNMQGSGKAAAIWRHPDGLGYRPCVEPSPNYAPPSRDTGKILYVHCNGGLNQMRAGICDMVAIARMLNATLLLPEVDKESFWQDMSEFSDIFDEDHFLKSLQGDVNIIKELPADAALDRQNTYRFPKGGFQSWSGEEYYLKEVKPLFDKYKVIRVMRSDARLANNHLPADIQKLRCRVHYDALRFHPAIEALGQKLVERMRAEGPFISLHLRYEKDMLAFSGCTHGLTPEEAEDLTRTRLETPHWRVKDIDSTIARQSGACPLTPTEVGLMLEAMGFPNTSIVYIAAGEIYGGEAHMGELRRRYPRLLRKEAIATKAELDPFVRHQSRMAALDYIVSVESDVFIPTYAGNMARAVEGHRRFLGHRRTITPDRKELVALFDKVERGEMQPGAEFAEAVELLHEKRQGAPRARRGPQLGTSGRDRLRSEESFYENPLPDCLCQDPSYKLGLHKDGSSMFNDRDIIRKGIWLRRQNE